MIVPLNIPLTDSELRGKISDVRAKWIDDLGWHPNLCDAPALLRFILADGAALYICGPSHIIDATLRDLHLAAQEKNAPMPHDLAPDPPPLTTGYSVAVQSDGRIFLTMKNRPGHLDSSAEMSAELADRFADEIKAACARARR